MTEIKRLLHEMEDLSDRADELAARMHDFADESGDLVARIRDRLVEDDTLNKAREEPEPEPDDPGSRKCYEHGGMFKQGHPEAPPCPECDRVPRLPGPPPSMGDLHVSGREYDDPGPRPPGLEPERTRDDLGQPLPRGWLGELLAEVAEDAKTWPEWMREQVLTREEAARIYDVPEHLVGTDPSPGCQVRAAGPPPVEEPERAVHDSPGDVGLPGPHAQDVNVLEPMFPGSLTFIPPRGWSYEIDCDCPLCGMVRSGTSLPNVDLTRTRPLNLGAVEDSPVARPLTQEERDKLRTGFRTRFCGPWPRPSEPWPDEPPPSLLAEVIDRAAFGALQLVDRAAFWFVGLAGRARGWLRR